MGITYDQLRRDGVFVVLGLLFPDQTSCRYILEDTGAVVSQIRPFGQQTPELYWREACRTIADGRFRDVTLETLLRAALDCYPGNETLLRTIGHGPDDGQLRVLCLAAAPSDQEQLRLGAEHREIVMATRQAPRQVTAVLHPAAQVDDVAARLLDARPHIVHFAGHGSPEGELVFETDRGYSQPVDVDLLGRLFKAVGHLQAVLLTSCYSARYADVLADCTEAVIGSPRPLTDACAVEFTRQFYRAIATYGGDPAAPPDVPACFEIALAATDLSGCPPHKFVCRRTVP